MKKVKNSSVVQKRKKSTKKVSKKYVTVYPTASEKGKNLFTKTASFFLRFIGTIAIFLTLSFSWSMIVIVVGLSRMIFLDADVIANQENQQTFYVIIGTFIVVGMFALFKTWRAWFMKKWLMAFWWAIFPLLYCGVCIVLLRFL